MLCVALPEQTMLHDLLYDSVSRDAFVYRFHCTHVCTLVDSDSMPRPGLKIPLKGTIMT